MGVSSDAYEIVLVLHILAAIVGFGAVFLNALYGRQAAARRGREGVAISEANMLVGGVAEYFIYAVFVTGLLLVWLSDEVWSFTDTWVWLSILVYVVSLGLAQGLLRPNARQMISLARELADGPPPAGGPPPQAIEIERRARIVGATGATLNVLLIVIIYLMVAKPG